jgi:ankyrin repeat protein
MQTEDLIRNIGVIETFDEKTNAKYSFSKLEKIDISSIFENKSEEHFIQSLKNPTSDFYLIRKNDEQIIALSYLWLSRAGNLVIDSIKFIENKTYSAYLPIVKTLLEQAAECFLQTKSMSRVLISAQMYPQLFFNDYYAVENYERPAIKTPHYQNSKIQIELASKSSLSQWFVLTKKYVKKSRLQKEIIPLVLNYIKKSASNCLNIKKLITHKKIIEKLNYELPVFQSDQSNAYVYLDALTHLYEIEPIFTGIISPSQVDLKSLFNRLKDKPATLLNESIGPLIELFSIYSSRDDSFLSNLLQTLQLDDNQYSSIDYDNFILQLVVCFSLTDLYTKMINKENIDLTIQDQQGRTLLHKLITEKKELSITLIKQVLEKNTSLNTKDSAGLTPLMLAVHEKSEELISLLLKTDRAVSIHEEDNKACFIHAAAWASPTLLALMLKKLNLDINSRFKEKTALFQALTHNNKIGITFLIQAGASFNQYVIEILNCDVLSVEHIELLIKKDFKLLEDKNRKAALFHQAILKNNQPVIDWLITHGATLDPNNSKDFDIFLTIIAQNYRESKDKIKIIELFLKYGFNINTTDLEGKNILYYAFSHQDESLIAWLLERDILIDMPQEYCQELIIEMIKYGKIEIINQFLMVIKPSLTEKYGDEALKMAITTRNFSIMETLIQKGATFKLESLNDLKILIQHLVKKEHLEMIKSVLILGTEPINIDILKQLNRPNHADIIYLIEHHNKAIQINKIIQFSRTTTNYAVDHYLEIRKISSQP